MLALVVLAFPLFAGDGDKAVSQGKNMIMMFTIGIFSLAMICLFALLVNFILYLVRRKKDKALIAVKRQYEVTVKENTDETKKVKRKRKNKKHQVSKRPFLDDEAVLSGDEWWWRGVMVVEND